MIGRLSLSGRRAIVTGAGAGLGRATARLFAGAGAHVLCVDRDAAAAGETAAAVGGCFAAIDVADRRAVCASETEAQAASGTWGMLRARGW